jgi:hypothetical protein
MAVFWDVAPCSLIDTECHFRELTVSIIRVMNKMPVNIYQTTWCYIPEYSHFHTHHCENLKSHQFHLLPTILVYSPFSCYSSLQLAECNRNDYMTKINNNWYQLCTSQVNRHNSQSQNLEEMNGAAILCCIPNSN